MPAWMTSLLRDEVSKPMPYSRSSTMTSMPARPRARATASPTTPAPMTTHSTDSDMARILRDRASHLKCRGSLRGLEQAFDRRGPIAPPFAQPIEIEIDDRRGEQGEELRDEE